MPDPPLLSIDDARDAVLSAVHHRTGTEELPVAAALGRVLAADVTATGDTPPFASSAMDGYALAAPDHAARATLKLAGESRAGSPYTGALRSGEAVRISTGAAVPAAAVAVIRQEDVEAGPDRTIHTRVAVEVGANIRAAGEDMRQGAKVIASGTRLGPSHIGAAIAAGRGTLTVAQRPRVVVACTGDELRPPGAPLRPGQIHNSNGPMLAALATCAGAEPAVLPSLPDSLEETVRVLGEGLEQADVLIVSGGVSVGPHDHVKPALGRLGVTEHFWGVALQPGKPTWFGTAGRRLVFALPGNPVSTAVTFTLFTRPALAQLQGERAGLNAVGEAELATEVRPNPSREQAIRVRIGIRDGRLTATPTGAQGSHLFTSLLDADALAIIPAGRDLLAAGTRVRLEPPPG